MLSKKKIIALCGLVLGLVAGGITASAIPDKAGSGESQRSNGTASGDSRGAADVPSLSNQKQLMSAVDGQVLSLDGIPIASRASYSTAYTYLRQCQARRQFETFVENSKVDPDSHQSRPEKIGQFDPDARARYLDRLAMLENRRQECADWEKNVSLDTAYEQLYLTALESALAGDQIAASCFVVRTWPMPTKGSPEYQRVASVYVENSKGLIDSGISSGSWSVVRAAAATLSSNDAVDSLLAMDSRTAYQISRLMQLGSGDSALSQTYGYDAAQFAAMIESPMELQRLDEEARQLFQTSFRSSYAEMTSFTTLCD